MSETWIVLEWPEGGVEEATAMARLLEGREVVLDASSAPSAWGAMEALGAAAFSVHGGEGLVNATSGSHAHDLLEGEIIQHFMCLGARPIRYYIVETTALPPLVVAGTREAIEAAIEGGLVCEALERRPLRVTRVKSVQDVEFALGGVSVG
ncbi:MAG: hypothetical protein JSS66_02935 [Armatimonadetes bacterium]|nr:hypothetical protein [Armatimonadota bacterium]